MVNRMRSNFEKMPPTPFCDSLLMESCRIYQELERLYEDILGAISDTNVSSVEKTTAPLTGLLQDAFRIDSAIAKHLGPLAKLAESTHTLLQQREDTLRRLHLSNRTLVNKAENIQSLVRHEIVDMAKNRSALKGYKPVETERTNIIRSSF